MRIPKIDASSLSALSGAGSSAGKAATNSQKAGNALDKVASGLSLGSKASSVGSTIYDKTLNTKADAKTPSADDGSSKGFQDAMGKVGNFLDKVPLGKSLLAPIFHGMSKGDSALSTIGGGLKGFAETVPARLKIAAGFLTGGPAGVGRAAAQQGVEDGVSIGMDAASSDKQAS